MKLSKKQRAMLRRDVAPHVSWMTSLLDDLDEAEARAERYRVALLRMIDRHETVVHAFGDKGRKDMVRTDCRQAREALDDAANESRCDCGGSLDGDRHESWCAAALAETANKTSERDGREGGCAVAPLPDVQLHPSRPAEAPQEPGTSSHDDAAMAACRRDAVAWLDECGDSRWRPFEQIERLAALLYARDARAREAEWNEAVEACAKFMDPNNANAAAYLRALKRPDRAKGGG